MIEGNHISVALTEGSFYSTTDEEWVEIKDIAARIECALGCGRMNIIVYDEESEWEATLSKEIPYYTRYTSMLTKTVEEYFDEELGVCDLVYHLYDMNGDGVKELILLTGSSEAEHVWNVYTILDGKPVLLERISGGHSEFCYSEDDGLYLVYENMGYLTIDKVTLNKKTLEMEFVYEGELDTDDEGTALYDRLKDCGLEAYELTDYSPLEPFLL